LTRESQKLNRVNSACFLKSDYFLKSKQSSVSQFFHATGYAYNNQNTNN